MRDEPQLQGLIEQFGYAAVWQAGEQANGFPPTWQLGGEHLMKVAEFLQNERRN